MAERIKANADLGIVFKESVERIKYSKRCLVVANLRDKSRKKQEALDQQAEA
jgi:hypothetical protein